jgi:hypothetical protein
LKSIIKYPIITFDSLRIFFVNEVAGENTAIGGFKSTIKKELLKLELYLKTETKNVELKIAQTKSDLLKW